MLRSLVVVSHKYPPYAGGGLAPYVERSLAALRTHRPDLPVELITLNYPENFPSVRIHDDGLRVVRPYVPHGLKCRYLDSGAEFDLSGRLWFGATILWFNLCVIWWLTRHGAGRSALVAVHDWQSTPAGIVAAVVLRMPVVYHVHNTELTMTDRGRRRDPVGLIRRCEYLMGRVAQRVVVPTPEMQDLLVGNGWRAKKICVVPHGFENPTTAPYAAADLAYRASEGHHLRMRLGLDRAARVLVFAGRLSAVKGIETLLRAVALVAVRHPHVYLVVLGVGFPGTDESATVHRVIDEVGLGSRVHVYDAYLPSESVVRHYDIAEACVFPSTFEPFGLVSVEAMALGRPVVLGPGFSRIIARDDSGPVAYQTRRDSSVELAEVLMRILDDPCAARAIGERGHDHVVRNLTWDSATDKLLTIYGAAAHKGV